MGRMYLKFSHSTPLGSKNKSSSRTLVISNPIKYYRVRESNLPMSYLVYLSLEGMPCIYYALHFIGSPLILSIKWIPAPFSIIKDRTLFILEDVFPAMHMLFPGYPDYNYVLF